MKAVVYACGSMGAVAVRRLLDAGFYIPLAISEEEPGSSSVHELGGALNIPCMAPRDPNQFGWVERARKTRPDMLFCFNYPTLLKAQVLAVPKHGSFRLHRALLPEHRGPDPVRRAIMGGQRTTGVTLHELVVEPYGGGVVARQQVDIARDDTAASLEKRMEQAADAMLATVLPRMKALTFQSHPRPPPGRPTNPHREDAVSRTGLLRRSTPRTGLTRPFFGHSVSWATRWSSSCARGGYGFLPGSVFPDSGREPFSSGRDAAPWSPGKSR